MTAKKKDKWYESTLSWVVAIFTIAGAVFSGGFYASQALSEAKYLSTLSEQRQQCNERIAEEKEKCATLKMQNFDKNIEALQTTVNELSRKKR